MNHNTFTVTSSGGVSFGIVRHCRTSDFVPDLSFPWSDNDGVSFWFSYLKKLFKSKSGRDCSDRKRMDTSYMSFLSAMTLLLFFVSSVRLANAWRADILMVSVMATRTFLRRSLTKTSWRSLPLLYALQSVRNCRWHDLSSMEHDQIWAIVW